MANESHDLLYMPLATDLFLSLFVTLSLTFCYSFCLQKRSLTYMYVMEQQ